MAPRRGRAPLALSVADRRTESRRGLLVVAFLLVALLVVVDLLRSDSLIRSALRGMGDPAETPLERLLEDVRP